jgi:hypothetical protein
LRIGGAVDARNVQRSDEIFLLAPPSGAAATTIAPGCNAAPRLTAREPWVGGLAMQVDLEGVPPAIPAMILLADRRQTTTIGNGCAFELGGAVVSRLVLPRPQGLARIEFDVPNAPTLRGLVVFAQGAMLDAASASGFALSNAMRLVVGD